MTGYQSKKAMARDKLLELAQEGLSMHSHDAPEYIVCEALIKALAQPAQRPLVDLTDEDWKEIEDMPDTFDQGVAWAQAKLKEKNNG